MAVLLRFRWLRWYIAIGIMLYCFMIDWLSPAGRCSSTAKRQL